MKPGTVVKADPSEYNTYPIEKSSTPGGYIWIYLRSAVGYEMPGGHILDEEYCNQYGGLGVFRSIATGVEELLWLDGVTPLGE